MTIAIVCAGWGDGIPRELSNKGFALIGGRRCPMLGRIDCDQFFVDISNVPNAKISDEVVRIGSQNQEHIPSWEWAEIIGGVSSHITFRTLITNRVTKKYVN